VGTSAVLWVLQVGLEVVVLCCAIKPLCAWNAEACATTSRERCGGQGYLSVNRFGELIGFAHAGMTAEGDNRWAVQGALCGKHCMQAQGGVPAQQQ
jgi:acyl-CoA oxidase